MATAKKGQLKDLIHDPKNANQHSQYGMGLLENSIRFNGLGRGIVISNDDVIIAGNGVVETAGQIGLEKLVIVETDGDEIVAIKRKDIQSGTKEFYNMALADNIVAKHNIVLSAEVVEAIVEEMPETKVWATIILEEPKKNSGPSNGREDLVEIKLSFSSRQYADFKKAIKLGKQKFQLENAESDSEQSNILHSILKEFIKNEK